jgi:hypothetical protein
MIHFASYSIIIFLNVALFILVRKIKKINNVEIHELYIILNKRNELVSWNKNHKILYNSLNKKNKIIPFNQWYEIVDYILLVSPDFINIKHFVDY